MPTLTPTETKAEFITNLPGLSLTLTPELLERKDAYDRVIMPGRPRVAVEFTDTGSDHGELELKADDLTEPCESCEGNGNLIREGEIEDCPRCEGKGYRTRKITWANGKRVDLSFETVVSRMRNHQLANVKRGFWETGKAPDEPLPRAGDQIAAIVQGAIALDAEKVNAVLAEERATQGRDEIIRQAEAALVQIEATNSEVELPPGKPAPEHPDAPPPGEPEPPPSVTPEPAPDTAEPSEDEPASQPAEAEEN